MIRWYYWAQEHEIDGELKQTWWHGTNELLRWSSVVCRQRRFTLGPIKFFFGSGEVDLEVIWRWADHVNIAR